VNSSHCDAVIDKLSASSGAASSTACAVPGGNTESARRKRTAKPTMLAAISTAAIMVKPTGSSVPIAV
jgi:hypothetical protein